MSYVLTGLSEAADFLHVDKQTIHRWRRAGVFPKGYKLGPAPNSAILWEAEELSAWLADHKEAVADAAHK